MEEGERERRKAEILQYLFDRGSASPSQVSLRSDISLENITKLFEELQDKELIVPPDSETVQRTVSLNTYYSLSRRGVEVTRRIKRIKEAGGL